MALFEYAFRVHKSQLSWGGAIQSIVATATLLICNHFRPIDRHHASP